MLVVGSSGVVGVELDVVRVSLRYSIWCLVLLLLSLYQRACWLSIKRLFIGSRDLSINPDDPSAVVLAKAGSAFQQPNG
ncbi:hypothetical protein [[Pseudomonas] boreopolis]|uniref:hypothetical protein n=1 Tax=Xanthomonas boreopolis TaxID=86183 RepID=UPI003D4FB3C4